MQFCRLYTGNDGKSHFEELDQTEGSEHFLAPLAGATMASLILKSWTRRKVQNISWRRLP